LNPLKLVAGTQRDGLDDIEWTERIFTHRATGDQSTVDATKARPPMNESNAGDSVTISATSGSVIKAALDELKGT
jgi:hypothetical protein